MAHRREGLKTLAVNIKLGGTLMMTNSGLLWYCSNSVGMPFLVVGLHGTGWKSWPLNSSSAPSGRLHCAHTCVASGRGGRRTSAAAQGGKLGAGSCAAHWVAGRAAGAGAAARLFPEGLGAEQLH